MPNYPRDLADLFSVLFYHVSTLCSNAQSFRQRSNNSRQSRSWIAINYYKSDRKDIDRLYSEVAWFRFHQTSATKNKVIERKYIEKKGNNKESVKKTKLVSGLRTNIET